MVRKNRFIVDVKVGREVHTCHCPCTGKIGNFDLRGRPCLLSRGNGTKRKTEYTMEAISLDEPDVTYKSWIGINQNAMNRYVEHYLAHGAFRDIVGDVGEIKREVPLANSKIDFRVGDVFIEVKSPLWRFEIPIPDHIPTHDNGAFTAYDRLLKHLNAFVSALEPHQRAIMLVCFAYDNDGLRVPRNRKDGSQNKVSRMFDKCSSLETWQANFKFTNRGVKLIRYFSLDVTDE